MDNELIKQFIKDNLLIETELISNYSDSVKVSLRFLDEKKPFTYSIINIPEQS